MQINSKPSETNVMKTLSLKKQQQKKQGLRKTKITACHTDPLSSSCDPISALPQDKRVVSSQRRMRAGAGRVECIYSRNTTLHFHLKSV